MDHKFTEEIAEEIGRWLNAPDHERAYTVGALLLLQLSGNQIMYINNIRALDKRKQFIEHNIQKYT